MSTASTSLAEGFTALLSAAGETLTFRASTVEGLVNRNVRADHLPLNPDFGAQEASEIELAPSALSTLPSPGESFTDASGLKHRVQLVQDLGPAIRCLCKTWR